MLIDTTVSIFSNLLDQDRLSQLTNKRMGNNFRSIDETVYCLMIAYRNN